jgi:HlyD family secretion protein
MKQIIRIILLTFVLGLSACGQAAAPTPIPTVSLDAPSSGGAASSSTVTASAEVVPVDKVELSFPMIGTVKSVDVKVGDAVKAGQSLASLDTTILEAKVAESQANVASAETQVRYLIRVAYGQQENVDSARADVDRAKAALDQAKAMLAQAALVSPMDGTVVSVEVSPGETAVPGLIIVIIGDLTNMQIETTDLSEQNIPAVQIGQVANVFIDALNQKFSGKVADIARQSTTVGGDTVYKVTIQLDEQPQGLRWGMSAEVEIKTEK